MLKIAVPNKGALSETAAGMLEEAGYHGRRDGKELIVSDPSNDVEFFYLRPRDIATYVGSGVIDVGITGRDLLLDSGSPATEVQGLGFGRSTFRFAGPLGTFSSTDELAGVRIASSYTGLVRSWLDARGMDATLVHLDGAVESAVRLGVADAIADVVETGATLRTQGLETFGEPILSSEAVLISSGRDSDGLHVLRRRLEGVLVARRYVMVDYDVRREDLDAAVRVCPGKQSATISPLRDDDWVAVRVMTESHDVNRVMDALEAAGAKAIIVTRIHAARV